MQPQKCTIRQGSCVRISVSALCALRLAYAEERLQFAMQLSQAEPKPSASSMPGSARQAGMTTQESTGFTAAAAAGQSVAVLQLEVQRLAADRTMLIQKMQVCICPHALNHAKCDCNHPSARRTKGYALKGALLCHGKNRGL